MQQCSNIIFKTENNTESIRIWDLTIQLRELYDRIKVLEQGMYDGRSCIGCLTVSVSDIEESTLESPTIEPTEFKIIRPIDPYHFEYNH